MFLQENNTKIVSFLSWSYLYWLVSHGHNSLLNLLDPLFEPALLLATNGAEGSAILMCFLSPSPAPSVFALGKTKQWLLLHLSPRCQCEHNLRVIYDTPHFLFIKWRPVSASPLSHLHFLISSALLLFKFACCLEKWTDGWAMLLPLPSLCITLSNKEETSSVWEVVLCLISHLRMEVVIASHHCK